MSEYKEECIKAKAIKRGIKDQRAPTRSSKKPKGDVIVEYRCGRWVSHGWVKWKAYASIPEAERAIKTLRVKNTLYEFRLKGTK